MNQRKKTITIFKSKERTLFKVIFEDGILITSEIQPWMSGAIEIISFEEGIFQLDEQFNLADKYEHTKKSVKELLMRWSVY